MMVIADIQSLSFPSRAVVPLVLAAIALYLLLPTPRKRSVIVGALVGLGAVALAGVLLAHGSAAPWPEKLLFYIFSGLAILGAGAMLTQRNPARAAISFAMVVMNVCGLFLLQGAPFLMAATLIIYAGAIIVTFLFVLMLAQQRGFSDADDRTREPLLASFAGFVLLGTILLVIDHAHPEPGNFDALLTKIDEAADIDDAAEKNYMASVYAIIGNREAFVTDLEEHGRRFASYPNAGVFDNAVTEFEEATNSNRPQFTKVRNALEALSTSGHKLQDEYRPKRLPAENVAGLGEMLYSRYLLPVEIGGTLLLVATIGAIAVTQRRPEAQA
jgi:NADH:ubiquinone oxidoreductase subunit 6 (subunit J)